MVASVPFHPRSLVRRVLPNPFRSTWFPRFRLPSWVARAESPQLERKERLSHPYGGDVTLRTSGSVSIHEHARVRAGWPKPYPLGAAPSLTSDAFPPPRLGGGPVPSRQIAFSARVSVGAFPSAIEWCARPAPATYSIRFSKTTAHASPHSEPRFPHWARGFPLLRWDIHFGGSFRSAAVCSTSGLFDPAHSGGPCLCPSVADPVIEPVSGPTRVIDLGRSCLTPRRRRQTIPVRKGFHPPSRPFTDPAPAFAVPGG